METTMNRRGNPRTLRAAQPDNLNALRSGVYSSRARSEREQEIERLLMDLPFAVPIDEIGAHEIASLLAIIDAADADLALRGLTGKRGEVRTLVDYRIRLSGRLERWLRQFGGTPSSRAELATKLTQSGVGPRLESELAEGNKLLLAAESQSRMAAGKERSQ
jgi:hypothetical protein